jgi:hypothetical protein
MLCEQHKVYDPLVLVFIWFLLERHMQTGFWLELLEYVGLQAIDRDLFHLMGDY